MKKFLFAIVALAISFTNLSAQDKIIEKSDLPSGAQTFMDTHFKKNQISNVSMDKDGVSKEYKVILSNGNKVEFDKKGNWKEVECKRSGSVPSAIVPTEIAKYVSSKFPKNKIVSIDKDSKGYDVELNNGIELKFNSKYKLIEVD